MCVWYFSRSSLELDHVLSARCERNIHDFKTELEKDFCLFNLEAGILPHASSSC